MKKAAVMIVLIFALGFVVNAQKKMKPWLEWNEKEATKVLDDSPWGQTQTETNTSEMFFSPTAGSSGTRGTQGALNQAVNVNFRIRLLSSRPIRQAIARRTMLQNPQLAEPLKAFAEQQTDKWIVVAVDYDSTDRRLSGPAMQAFNSAVIGTLKNNTYLETKDGKRLFIEQYMAPIADGMGAKYVFPRLVDGKPFVTAESGYLRFYSELTPQIKLNMRFKVSDMNYDGRLEY